MATAHGPAGGAQHRDAAAPLIGWRYWQVRDGRLRSASYNRFEWPPGEPLHASCLHGHRPPQVDCGCGLYGAVDLATLRARRMCLTPGPIVAGEVALWGRVLPDEGGWRAATAYPHRLLVVGETCPSGDDSDVVAALTAYGVPVGGVALADVVDEVSARLLANQAMSAGAADQAMSAGAAGQRNQPQG